MKKLFLSVTITGLLALIWLNSQFLAGNAQNTFLQFNLPTPPDQGMPVGRRRGGASRGNCPQYNTLTALVPANGDVIGGLTTATHPSFWFYLPESLSEKITAEFVLQDAQDNYLYQTRQKNLKAGIIGIPLPENVTSLSLNQPYLWTFSLNCDGKIVFVQGIIHRVSLDTTAKMQLKTTHGLEEIAFYANNGIWHDSLTLLAKKLQIEPQNPTLVQAWNDLLQQIGLTTIPTSPITVVTEL